MSDKSLSTTALMRSLSSAGRPSSSIARACFSRMAVRTACQCVGMARQHDTTQEKRMRHEEIHHPKLN